MHVACRWTALMPLLLVIVSRATAHPEYQLFIQQHSGRSMNCAMCHVHSDGPEGASKGQIGSLGEEEMNRLLVARSAFEPGQAVDNPILNDFGNNLVHSIGKKALLEYRSDPIRIALALGDQSDMDGDGVSDAQEFLSGTHPLMKSHGPPIMLFWNNLFIHRLHLVMMLLATGFGIWGLNNVLLGMDQTRQSDRSRIHD